MLQVGEYTIINNQICKKIDETEFKPVNTFDYPIGKKQKGELRKIAKTANIALADWTLDLSDFKTSVSRCLIHLKNDWNANIVKSPLFNNARIRFDGDSFRHFYYSGRNARSQRELELRAKCLPYLRNIIEKSGVKACCSVENGQLGFVIMGRSKIDGKDTAIKVIIAKKKKDKLYYLSVNNLGEI